MKKIMTEKGEVDVAYVDGYSFGDRLLEGVWFTMKIVDGQLKCRGVHAEHEQYMRKFSKKQITDWKLTAERPAYHDSLVADGDVEAWIEDDSPVLEAESETDEKDFVPRQIKAYSTQEIMDLLRAKR